MKRGLLLLVFFALLVFLPFSSSALECKGVEINCTESSVDCIAYANPAKNVIYNDIDKTLQFFCSASSDGLCPENFFTGDCAGQECSPEDIDCLPILPAPPAEQTFIEKPKDACDTQEKISITGSVDVEYSANIFCESPPCNITWNFGDGETAKETIDVNSYISSGIHTYIEKEEMGPVKISLVVVDAKGKKTENSVRIYLDRPAPEKNDRPIACIDWPKGIVEIEEGEIASIVFNATSSFDDITEKEKIIYNWTIVEIGTEEIIGRPSGKGFRLFNWTFGRAGKYLAKLLVNDSDPVDVAEEEFTITGCILEERLVAATGRCSADKRYFCSSDNTLYTTIGDAAVIEKGAKEGGCEGKDGIAGTRDDCCPANYYCPQKGTCQFQPLSCADATTKEECEKEPRKFYCAWIEGMGCVDPSGLSCSDYPNEHLCVDDPLGLGQYGIGTENCGASYSNSFTFTITKCYCKWNGACNLLQETIINPNPQDNPHYICKTNVVKGNCDETTGKQKITLKADITWTGTPTPTSNQEEAAKEICKDREYFVLCGARAAGLPFFTFFSFIITLFLLAAYYLIKKQGK